MKQRVSERERESEREGSSAGKREEENYREIDRVRETQGPLSDTLRQSLCMYTLVTSCEL